jgi:hypothetical protein
MVSERQRRIGENEAVFRALNEEVRGLTKTFTLDTETIRVICECGTRSCTEQFPIRVHVYARIRQDPTLFAIKPGHDFPETERVVQKHDAFWIVQKNPGLPADIARATEVGGDGLEPPTPCV